MPSKPGRPAVSTSFKKGHPPTPGAGRPLSETTIAGQLKILLAKQPKVEGYEGLVNNAEALAMKLLDMTLKSETLPDTERGVSAIADRTEGKPKQTSDVTSNGRTITPILGGLSVSGDNGNEEDSAS